MSSLKYINEKLNDAIYILTIHEGDARTRLARVLPKILFLSGDKLPDDLKNDLKWIQKKLEENSKNIVEGTVISKLSPIRNTGARKIIEKIVYLKNEIELMMK